MDRVLSRNGGIVYVGDIDNNGDQISFRTSGSDRIRIDENGLMGLGITNPVKIIHTQEANNTVHTPNDVGSIAGMRLYNSSTTANAGVEIQLMTRSSGTSTSKITGLSPSDNNSEMAFSVETANTINEVMRIAGSSVGIGNDNPSFTLDVHGNTSGFSSNDDANCIVYIDSGATTGWESVLMFRDQGSNTWKLFKNSSNQFSIQEQVGAGTNNAYMTISGALGVQFSYSHTANNNEQTVFSLRRYAEGANGANGIGAKMLYQIENSAGGLTNAGTFNLVMTNATSGSEDTVYKIYLIENGSSNLAMQIYGSGFTKIDGITNSGLPLLALKQDDADEPFIWYNGTSAANTSNNITTYTTGNSIQGFVRVQVEAADYWMPYYDAPTS
jgi:hypothetical protein